MSRLLIPNEDQGHELESYAGSSRLSVISISPSLVLLFLVSDVRPWNLSIQSGAKENLVRAEPPCGEEQDAGVASESLLYLPTTNPK